VLAPALRIGWLVAEEPPEAVVHGIAAGLCATVELPGKAAPVRRPGPPNLRLTDSRQVGDGVQILVYAPS
jgi:hypothetical protein